MKSYSVAQKSRQVPLDRLLTKRRWNMPTGWVKDNLSKFVAQILCVVQEQKDRDDAASQPVEREHIPELGAFVTHEHKSTITSADKNTLGRIAHAFIQFSLEDGESSTTDAIKALENMQSSLIKAQAAFESQEQAGQSACDQMQSLVGEMSASMAQAVSALQFYDRVGQRMAHSMACLQILHGADLSLAADDEEGRKTLLEVFYRHLSMEDERAIFNAIQAGGSIKRAVEIAHKRLQEQKEDDSSVQLF
jgi:hypothetical protein